MLRTKEFIRFLALLLMPIGQLAVDIYMPSLPHMAVPLQTNNSLLQLTVSVFLLALGISLFISGPLSEAFGRRTTIMTGIIIYFVTSILAAQSSHIAEFLLLRFIQGLGAGAIITAARASIGETFSGEVLRKTSANMALIWGFIPVLAPLIGGYVQQYLSWRVNFLILAGYSLIGLALTFFFQAETCDETGFHHIRPKKIKADLRYVFSNKSFLGYATMMTMTYTYVIFYNVSAPFLLQNRLGLRPDQYGRIILLVSVAFIMGGFLNKRLIKKRSSDVLITLGVAIIGFAALTFLAMAVAKIFTIASVIVPAAFIFLAIGILYPNAMGNAMALFPKRAGVASSLLGFFPMIGCGLGSVIAAIVPEASPMPLAVFTIVIAALLTAVNFVNRALR